MKGKMKNLTSFVELEMGIDGYRLVGSVVLVFRLNKLYLLSPISLHQDDTSMNIEVL